MVETGTHMEGHVFTHNVGWVLEHLKHPLKTIDRYWSLVSNRGQMARVCWDIIAPYIPKLYGNDDVSFIFFSLILMFWLWMEWWMALYRRGPPIWWTAIGLTTLVSFFLGLRARSAKQWSSVEVLSNQLLQVITYHRYVSLRGTSSLETGVVLYPHVSGLHQDRKFSVPYL